MRILRAKWVLVCDENFKILKEGAIVFDKKIIEVCTFASAARKYPRAEILDFSGDIALRHCLKAGAGRRSARTVDHGADRRDDAKRRGHDRRNFKLRRRG